VSNVGPIFYNYNIYFATILVRISQPFFKKKGKNMESTDVISFSRILDAKLCDILVTGHCHKL